MSDLSPSDNHFLKQLGEAIAANLANEQFGVTELADAMNMSRSNLLRKVKKLTNLAVNQLIREARLKRAMELLQNSTANVSEVSHQVGFNSTSYFIKCFREHYGYPPGEAGKRPQPDVSATRPRQTSRVSRRALLLSAYVLLGMVAAGSLAFYYFRQSAQPALERSIVVLPFKNESNDSTNVYLINGLMESTLNNLQKISDLRVLSRTSSEKYRNTTKSIPEMSSELEASYFVEGSGQKIGDQILLNIQLIEGPTDRHVWAKQYRRKATDIFALQQEVAKNIAAEIEVIITPEAQKSIEKIPTENLEAYALYLKGMELFYQSTGASLMEAMSYFRQAIALDDKFGLAYAHLVQVEYYLDIFQLKKNYTGEISAYADKALLFEPRSGESLIAKALSYAYVRDYKPAVLYLEKALEYNPHSGRVYHFLTEFYSLYVPDPAKYTEYALRGAKEDRVTMDSSTIGFKYFHVANALVQAGFIDEGVHYVDLSLSYDLDAFFSRYVSVLFRFAKNKDLKLTKQGMIREFEKDTTRADVVKELAKICYIDRDYDQAYKYYQIFLRRTRQLQLEIYQEELLSISVVYDRFGRKAEAEEFRKRYKDFINTDQPSIYKHVLTSLYYAHAGDSKKALEELALFSKEDNYPYWILFIENDPIVDNIRELPEFKRIMAHIEKKFWDRRARIQEELEEKGLYPFDEYLPSPKAARK
jgi:TolB-like protein/AraC-like DNA-binding protein